MQGVQRPHMVSAVLLVEHSDSHLIARLCGLLVWTEEGHRDCECDLEHRILVKGLCQHVGLLGQTIGIHNHSKKTLAIPLLPLLLQRSRGFMLCGEDRCRHSGQTHGNSRARQLFRRRVKSWPMLLPGQSGVSLLLGLQDMVHPLFDLNQL